MSNVQALMLLGRESTCSASRSSRGASMSVSGVRNSWLTLLKNSVLARSISASASARFFSFS